MLFHSSLRKELIRNFGATFVVLVTIVMTVMLIRTLGRASAGAINPSEVVLILGYTVLGYLATILTLSLFIAITSALTRMYGSSEMVVWFSCGRGLASFLRPLLQFSLPVLVLIALLATLAWPWSNLQIEQLRDRFQNRGDIERVAPGQFIESAGGRRVFFIDKKGEDNSIGKNIFISTSTQEKDTIVSAHEGTIDNTPESGAVLVLSSGMRVETRKGSGNMRISAFSQYESRISDEPPGLGAGERPRLQSTVALLQGGQRDQQAELSWRLGLILVAFNCILLALAATRVNPRVARNAGLVFTLLSFATYYNMISVGETWIRGGRIPTLAYMLLLHGGVLALALGWMAWRERNWRRIRPSASPDQATP